jgi:hypothetical protein
MNEHKNKWLLLLTVFFVFVGIFVIVQVLGVWNPGSSYPMIIIGVRTFQDTFANENNWNDSNNFGRATAIRDWNIFTNATGGKEYKSAFWNSGSGTSWTKLKNGVYVNTSTGEYSIVYMRYTLVNGAFTTSQTLKLSARNTSSQWRLLDTKSRAGSGTTIGWIIFNVSSYVTPSAQTIFNVTCSFTNSKATNASCAIAMMNVTEYRRLCTYNCKWKISVDKNTDCQQQALIVYGHGYLINSKVIYDASDFITNPLLPPGTPIIKNDQCTIQLLNNGQIRIYNPPITAPPPTTDIPPEWLLINQTNDTETG